MAKIPHEVVSAFKRHQPWRAGNFYSTGDALYSYGMRLAHWAPTVTEGRADLIIELDYLPRWAGGQAPSATTARHMAALEAQI